MSRKAGPNGEQSYDCRPSDGLALAVRAKAPIWISDSMFRKAAIRLPGDHPKLDDRLPPGHPPIPSSL